MMIFRRILTLLLILMLAAIPAVMADDSFNMNKDGFSTSYTYDYDYWGDIQEAPDAYRISTVIDSVTLEKDLNGIAMNKPQGLYVRDRELYIADTFNNRIIQLHCEEDGTWIFVRLIETVNGADPAGFSNPYDVFADQDGNLYVADHGNHRVIMVDKDLNFIKQFIKPADSTFDQSNEFLPKKITVDESGRLYVLATNVNKGLVKFEADCDFTGFIGANKVTVSTAEYIWKRYFQTQEQRNQSVAFVPTEYENLYIDQDGFIYVTTTTFSEYDLKWDNAKPIRRLNSLGNDILIKNDHYPPIGDLWWAEGDSTYYGPSRLTDITVLQNDIYVALDRTRGRLFGYDSQGVMLWAFGNRGNMDGTFMSAIALEHMGTDLLVLDQLKNTITVFSTTEYGNLIYDAISAYQQGRYEESGDIWHDVMKLNANYNLAFRGIGRSLMRQDRFREAMDYFEKGHDTENYGRAFKQYRKIWVEQNIWWIVLVAALLLIIPVILGRFRKAKWEVMMYEHNHVRKV